MIPERIDPLLDGEAFCRLCSKWRISEELAERIVCMATRLPFSIRIISGYRSPEKQRQLAREGRPAADPNLSTHTTCPAIGADLFPSIAITRVVKAEFGAAAVACGLRWGGGSPPDPETGIPSDWNHVDLGPRWAQ